MGHGTAPNERRLHERAHRSRRCRTTRAGARRRHRHDAPAVAEHDPLDAHLVQPLPAPAARRRGDRRDDEVAGPVPLGDRARERRPLRAHAERIRGVLDVHALDHAAVAREHRAARRGSSSTAHTRAPRPRPRRRGAPRRSAADVAHPNAWKRKSVTSAPSTRAAGHLGGRVHAGLDASLRHEQRHDERHGRDRGSAAASPRG